MKGGNHQLWYNEMKWKLISNQYSKKKWREMKSENEISDVSYVWESDTND